MALKPPTNLRELRRVLGMIQFYGDIQEKRTHIIKHLTDLVGSLNTKNNKKKKKYYWDEVHQQEEGCHK